jgi:hypothetical protein
VGAPPSEGGQSSKTGEKPAINEEEEEEEEEAEEEEEEEEVGRIIDMETAEKKITKKNKKI